MDFRHVLGVLRGASCAYSIIFCILFTSFLSPYSQFHIIFATNKIGNYFFENQPNDMMIREYDFFFLSVCLRETLLRV